MPFVNYFFVNDKLILDCLSDTIFVIDSTSSVRNLFEQHRIYASNVVNGLDVSPDTNHIGIVLYSSKQRQSIKISLSYPQNKENVTAKIASKLFCINHFGHSLTFAFQCSHIYLVSLQPVLHLI